MSSVAYLRSKCFLAAVFCFLFLLSAADHQVSSFSTSPAAILRMSADSSSNSKNIYGIPNANWAAKREWNWGSAIGTGHDAAMICRNKYSSPNVRQALAQALIDAPDIEPSERKPTNFEEVKLILGLSWQRGRWDGSDGGVGGYGDVLSAMAQADRYETDSDEESSIRLVIDMKDRFHLLDPSDDQIDDMNSIESYLKTDPDAAQRKCSGLVLQAMGFVPSGL